MISTIAYKVRYLQFLDWIITCIWTSRLSIYSFKKNIVNNILFYLFFSLIESVFVPWQSIAKRRRTQPVPWLLGRTRPWARPAYGLVMSPAHQQSYLGYRPTRTSSIQANFSRSNDFAEWIFTFLPSGTRASLWIWKYRCLNWFSVQKYYFLT